jgi:hypothetical protein
MSEHDDADVIEQAPRPVSLPVVPGLSALRGALGAGHRRVVVIAAACALLVIAATLVMVRLTAVQRTDPALARLITEVTTVPVGTSMPGWRALADPASPDEAYWSMLTISLDTHQAVSGPPLRRDGKPEVLYAGTEYCPYCAMESWPLIVALSRFGAFSGLATSRSSRFEQLAPVDGWTFYGSRYTSRYLSFVPVERYSNVLVNAKANPDAGTSYRVLQRFTPAQRAIFRKYDKSGATPFLDFANRAVQIGSDLPLSPRMAAGKSWARLAAALRRPKTPLGAALLGEADVLTAELCGLTGDRPAAACPAFLPHVQLSS